MAVNFHSVSAQEEDEEEFDEEEEEEEEALNPLTVHFVNEHPRDTIQVFWVNGDFDEDDPERRVSVYFCDSRFWHVSLPAYLIS
jgi:ribonuclease PH